MPANAKIQLYIAYADKSIAQNNKFLLTLTNVFYNHPILEQSRPPEIMH